MNFFGKIMLHNHLSRPLEISPITNHEFHFITQSEMFNILPEVPLRLPARRRLEINDPNHARITGGNVRTSARRQQDRLPPFRKRLHQ